MNVLNPFSLYGCLSLRYLHRSKHLCSAVALASNSQMGTATTGPQRLLAIVGRKRRGFENVLGPRPYSFRSSYVFPLGQHRFFPNDRWPKIRILFFSAPLFAVRIHLAFPSLGFWLNVQNGRTDGRATALLPPSVSVLYKLRLALIRKKTAV